jgi:hypothetical protein
MFKSNYDYKVKEKLKIISIVDLGGVFMSVTNNAEGVIEEIEKKEGIDAREYNIIYRDSDGIWDGMKYHGKDQPVDFIFIGEETEENAIKHYK